ncbi:dihydropteroate synthase [bacterium]|nr:dihydropteroate synthase [bacterium]
MFNLNVKGRLYSLKEPWIMGILNTTPDSFFDGGRFNQVEQALAKARTMEEEGAHIIDVGGYSSRPGADEVSIDEEISRVVPVVEAIRKESNILISIDTFRSQVAIAAVEAGADIVNDISAGEDDPEMISTVSSLKVPYIVMHKKGVPKTMHQNPEYKDVSLEVFQYLQDKLHECRTAGIKDLILDPGFGFGKSIAHNYELLANLDLFKMLDAPLLVGISRKSMIYKVLNTEAENALLGTQVLNTWALKSGAHILRVHDVKECVQTVKIWKRIQEYL